MQTRGEREAPTRTRASRFTSIRARHKKNKHPPGNTNPGGCPLSNPRYSPISGKPAKHRQAGKKKNERGKGTQVTTNANNNAAGAAGSSQYVTDKNGRTWKRTTFGQLQEGDMIPDENGNPTRVTVAYPTHVPQQMIEFTHKNGSFTVGGTHLLYIETDEDTALHAHRLHAARETLAPLTGNPGVRATLETTAHHGDTATSATGRRDASDTTTGAGADTPPTPGSALSFRDTCTPEELYDAVLASWNQYAHYLNRKHSGDGDGQGETTATGDTYIGDRAVSHIAATLALETHRCAAAIGPAAEDTALGYTSPDSEHTTSPVSAPQLAAQLLAVCAGGKYARQWPPICGRVITALEAERLLQEGHTLHIPNPPTNLT